MEPPVIVALGATFLSVMLFLVGVYDLSRRRQLISERLQRYDTLSSRAAAEALAPGTGGVLRDRSLSSFSALDQLLRGSGLGEGMALDLARANLSLRVGEYLLIRLLAALVLALLPLMMDVSLPVIVLAALVGFYLPRLYVSHRERTRVREFNNQLMDATTMIANSLKAGFSFIQGLELVSKEMPAPISEEISQVLGEMNLGSSAEDALVNLTKRVRSYDLDLIVTAMLIQRQAGGNLSEILINISRTIRDRIRMQNEIRALTGEVRISAYILGALPIVMMVALTFINRGYLLELLTNPTGQIMLAAAAVMEVLGFIVLRRMAAIEV
ncbi:MAG: type II secretion system F family protein [Bacteroidetes bacterium]|nr:type II secretion system F family protein [Bacteroidota bacterium]MCL5026972.1 type II secretion system F family protein [Chloroflexota bacterium]